MRRALLAVPALAMAIAAGGVAAQAPQRPPARPAPPQPAGWTMPADDFFTGLSAADQANGFRAELLDSGCGGHPTVLCNLRLRDVPIRVRATFPDRRITEVEVTLAGRGSIANGAAALHSVARWAEPTAPNADRAAAVRTLLDGVTSSRSATIGRTEFRAQETFSGMVVTARPLN